MMKNVFNRENILPIALFFFGTVTIYFVGEQSHKLNKKEREAQIKVLAADNKKKLDLLFSNNLIRIQSFFAELNEDVQKTLSNNEVVQPFLDSTLFQRVSLINSRLDSNLSKDLNFRRLRTSHGTSDSLPISNSPFLKSIFLKNKIKAMKLKNIKHSMALSLTEDANVFSLLWRTHNRTNYFVIFSTPINEVLKNIVFAPSLAIYIYDTENDVHLIIQKNDKGHTVLITEQKELTEIIEKSQLITESSNTELYGTLSIQWHALPDETIGYLPKAIWVLGTIIVTLIALFLRFVLIQNARISELVVRRTEDLEIALNESTEANIAKNRFLANISHELRTPLNLIIGIFDILEEDITNTKLKTYLKSAKLSSEHLLELITDLLHTSQDHQLSEENIAIKTVTFFEEIVTSSSLDCQKKNLQFYFHIHPDVPSVIVGNPLRVRQILLNLIRNSIKYTNQGFISVTVTMTQKNEQSARLSIAVQDSGVGIPEKKFKAIFERFVQLDSAKILSQGGVGLGLSIVKDLVEKLHGKIFVNSIEQQGTTFTVELDFSIVDGSPWISKFTKQKNEPQNIIVSCHDSITQKYFKSYFANLKIFHDFWVPDGSSISQKINSQRYTHAIVDAFVKENLPLDILEKLIILEKYVNSKPTIKIEYLSLSPLLPSVLMNSIGYTSKNLAAEKKREIIVSSSLENVTDSLSLLIVDDDDGNQLLFEAYLKNQKWNLSFAKNGQEAFEIYKTSRPDLIIADLRMPLVDGLQLSRLVRAYEQQYSLQKIPILIVSADALHDTAENIKNYDITSYITKPVKKVVLMNEISNALKSRSIIEKT